LNAAADYVAGGWLCCHLAYTMAKYCIDPYVRVILYWNKQTSRNF